MTMKLVTKCLFYGVVLIVILKHREQFLSLWTIETQDTDYVLDDHTPFPFDDFNYDVNKQFSYEAVAGYDSTTEKFLVFEDYFDLIENLETDQNFFISTILDSSRIEYLKLLHWKLSEEETGQLPLISAAIYAKNIADLCFIIDATRNIPIVISLVIDRSFFIHGYIDESVICSTFPYADTFDKTTVWFPNNLLRNVARLPNSADALPELFLSIDVDLIPSSRFLTKINAYLQNRQVPKDELLLIIVFETRELSAVKLIETKSELEAFYKNGTVQIFHQWCDVCYNFYDYPKWFKLADTEEVYPGYAVNYRLSFEPYFLASNLATPFHDPRFRGYGYNKVVHAYQLAKQKFKFMVLSDTFLIHDGIKSETSGTASVEQEVNTRLFREAKSKINNNIFTDFNPLHFRQQ